MTLRVIPMGGLGEIGLNCMLFDDGGTALLIDAGLLFPDDTMLGVDYVVPDFSVLRETAPHLGALLLTHGHEDHIGAVPFLLREFDIPVYGTRLTLGLLRHRLAEHGLEASARLFPIARDARFRIGNFDVEAFPVCHSIPDAVGYVLRCPEGIFVHTGDFKIDPYPLDGVPTGVERLRAISAAEGVTALFSDSTNVEREGVSPPEKFVGEALAEIFGQVTGRVVVGMFSSNLPRIQEAIKAAYACGRRVALVGRSMVRNVATAIDLGYLALPSPDILIPVEEAVSLPDRAVAVLTTGSQGEPRSALTLMALGEHKHLKVRPSDTIVLSSKFIPGNERAIAGLINRFFLAGADVLYEKISEIHVSGHASVEELRTMIAAVRPANFVPVHGEPRLLVRHRNLAREAGVRRVAMLRNGDVLVFSGGEMSLAGRIEVGRRFVDGKGIGDVESLVLKDRVHLSQVGLVMVVLAFSSTTGELLYGPDIVTRGVVTESGTEALVEGARDEVLRAIEEIGSDARTDTAEMQTAIRRVVRRFFNKRIDRKPMIVPVLLEL
jgi:ribonuclease J